MMVNVSSFKIFKLPNKHGKINKLSNSITNRMSVTDDEIFNNFDSTINNEINDRNNDKELEKTMALELYNELKGSNESLFVEQFVRWEDIQGV